MRPKNPTFKRQNICVDTFIVIEQNLNIESIQKMFKFETVKTVKGKRRGTFLVDMNFNTALANGKFKLNSVRLLKANLLKAILRKLYSVVF